MVVSLNIGSVKKDLLLNITFHSFLVRGIVGNKSQEFLDLVPFPLPVSGEESRSRLEVTANLSPTGMSRISKTGSGKSWLSELCGGRSKFRGGNYWSYYSS